MRRATSRATAACRVEVIVGEEITTRGGHLLGLFLERPRPAAQEPALVDRGGPRPGRDRDPGPSPRARIRCARRAGCCAALLDGRRSRSSTPTRSRRSTPPRSAGTATSAWSRFAAEHGLAPRRQQRRPRARGDRHRLDGASRAGPRTTCGRAILAGETTPPRRLPRLARGSSGRSAASCASTAATLRDEVGGRIRRDGTRPRPRLSRRHPAAAACSTRRAARAGR